MEESSITSVPMGSPRRKPRVQTEKVMEPSQGVRAEGLMATSPWITEWKRARHCEIPSRIRVK